MSEATEGRTARQHPFLRDLGVVLAWFVVLGAVAAVVWWRVTPLAEYTRGADGAAMGEDQLSRQVYTDGWFVVIGGVAALMSGIVLLGWRRRDPIAMVVLVALGSLLAGWVMLRVGLWLGPPDPRGVLAHAAVDAEVPLQLEPHAKEVLIVWPLLALLGAVAVVFGVEERRSGASTGTPPEEHRKWDLSTARSE